MAESAKRKLQRKRNNALPAEKAKRAARNRARRKAIASSKAKVGDGTVMHHPRRLSGGGSLKGGTVKRSRKSSNQEGGRVRRR